MRILVEVEDFKKVENKKSLERKCFMVDAHGPNVIMFHYSLRDRIISHELVRNYKLIIQVNLKFFYFYSIPTGKESYSI